MAPSKPHKLKGFDFNYRVCILLQDMTASKAALKLGMSLPALSYHLRKLKKLDVIKYIGKGTWEVDMAKLYTTKVGKSQPKQVKKTDPGRSGMVGGVGTDQATKNFKEHQRVATRKTDEIGGHGYMFVLKLPHLTRWNQTGRRKYLASQKIEHTPIQQGESLERDTEEGKQLTLGWKIWLTNKSIVGWAPKGVRWLAEDETSAAADAFYHFMRVVKKLETALGVAFTINGQYQVRPRREHNAHLKSLLPGIIRQRGELLAVWDDTGTWLKIDESTGEPELETEASGSTKRIMEIRDASALVRADYNLLKDEGVTRQYLMEQIAAVARLQREYAENIQEHVRVMRKIGNFLERIEEREKNGTDRN